MTVMMMPGVGVGVESNHIVVAVDGEVRLPVQCNHDDKDDHDDECLAINEVP